VIAMPEPAFTAEPLRAGLVGGELRQLVHRTRKSPAGGARLFNIGGRGDRGDRGPPTSWSCLPPVWFKSSCARGV
jgi:hypothetical protein